MLVLSFNSGEVQGLFCKNISACGVSPSWAVSVWADATWAAPQATTRSRARCVAWATRENSFFFFIRN